MRQCAESLGHAARFFGHGESEAIARRTGALVKTARRPPKLKERALRLDGQFFAEVLVGFLGRDAAARGATEVALLQ